MIVVTAIFALILQAGHVCPPAAVVTSGVQDSFSLFSPTCPVCALAHSLLLTLLLILFSLIALRSRTLPVSQAVRPMVRGLRMDLRAPPAL